MERIRDKFPEKSCLDYLEEYDSLTADKVSGRAKAALRELLASDPEKRASLEQASELLTDLADDKS